MSVLDIVPLYDCSHHKLLIKLSYNHYKQALRISLPPAHVPSVVPPPDEHSVWVRQVPITVESVVEEAALHWLLANCVERQ